MGRSGSCCESRHACTGRIQYSPQHRCRRTGNIYVADRGNRRIQVYDHDGNFKKIITIDVPVAPNAKSWFSNAGTQAEIASAGAPWAVCITPGPGTQYLYSADAYPGRIYKLSLDGKVLGWLGRSGRQ